MRTKFNGILTLLLVLVVQLTFAQEKTISGTVTDNSGLPLPGVNIIVKGTSNGTQSDFDGNYSIQAATGQTLTFSYVGFSNIESSIGSSNSMSVTMEEDAALLEEVIITAQGIKKEVKALGYAVSTIDSEKLESKPQADVSRLLRGNAPGVNVISSGGLSGSGTAVIIRGFSSINGSNQALFVIDGIPFDSSVNTEGNFFNNANASSRSLDLDPNQIASISVLKGLSATTLYGEQGRNGVVLITTKGGGTSKGKTSISVNQSVFANDIVLPDYTEKYGGGFYNDWGPFFSNWGTAFADRETIPNSFQQWADLFPDNPEYAEDEVKYQSYDNAGKFFKTGFITSTSVSANGGTSDANFNVAFGHLNDESFLPGNSFTRTNFSVGGLAKLSNKFTVSGKLNYSQSSKTSPLTDASLGSDVVTGGIASVWNALYTPRSINLNGLPFQSPVNNQSIWYRDLDDRTNPLWTLNNSEDKDDTSRIFGFGSVNYAISDNLSLGYNFGLDTYTTNYLYGVNRGSRDGEFSDGFLKTVNYQNTITNHNVKFAYDGALLKDSDDAKIIGLNAVVGTQLRNDQFKRQGQESRGQQIQGYGLFNHGVFDQTTSFIGAFLPDGFFVEGDQYDVEETLNQAGIYASLSFDYKNFLFLNVSGRKDWSSSLEKEFNSIVSKSASISFLPTSAFPSIKGKVLSYLKLRGGYGEAPGFTDPYQTRGNLVSLSSAAIDTDGNAIPTNSINDILPNPFLKSELSKELEAGVDAKFFNNRLGFQFTYFKRDTEDQIVESTPPSEFGGTTTFSNLGLVRNEGIELGFNIAPVRNENFSWDINGNYEILENTVVEVETDVLLGGYTNLGAYAIEGEPFGVLVGDYIQRDENDNFLTDDAGYWIASDDNSTDGDVRVVGDPNADWKLNATNTFAYKQLSLAIQVDYQHGGDIYARTANTFIARGLTTDTDFDRSLPIILPGVNSTTGAPNDVIISSTDAYFNNLGFGPAEVNIYDASHIKLRDVTLTYRFSKEALARTPFGTVNLSLSGQNLFVRAFNTPKGVNYDPELNSVGAGNNSRGFDFLTSWNSRRYGMSVKLTF